MEKEQQKSMELDDGKISTGKPKQFHGKNHGFRLRFSPTNQSIEKTNPQHPFDTLMEPWRT